MEATATASNYSNAITTTYHVGSHTFASLAEATVTANHHHARTGIIVAITERKRVDLAALTLAELCHMEDATAAIHAGMTIDMHLACYKAGAARAEADAAFRLARVLVLQLGTTRKAVNAVDRAVKLACR